MDYLVKITERLDGGKGEVFEEIDGDAITGVGGSRGFHADYLCLGGEMGNRVEVQERQGRRDGEGEDLPGLEGRLMVEMEKAPRYTDISNNSMALVQFTAFRMQGLIMDRQRNYETIEAPSFQGGEHAAPIKLMNSLNLYAGGVPEDEKNCLIRRNSSR